MKRFNAPVRDDGSWNFRLRVTRDPYRNQRGWRVFEIGAFRLKPNIPDGEDTYYYVDRGFWWKLNIWLPWESYR